MIFGKITMKVLQEIKDRLEITTHDFYGDFTYSSDIKEHIEEINQIIEELTELNAPKSLALFKEVKTLLLEIDEYTFESLNVINAALNELKCLNIKTLDSYLASEDKEIFYMVELKPFFGNEDFQKNILISELNFDKSCGWCLDEYLNVIANVSIPKTFDYRIFKIKLNSSNLVDRLKEFSKAELIGWGSKKL